MDCEHSLTLTEYWLRR